MSDLLVISVLENGELKLMVGQVEVLLDKFDWLLCLCCLLVVDKYLVLMFWNYLEGEKNVVVLYFNVLVSLVCFGEVLWVVGYWVVMSDESVLIDIVQCLFGGYYWLQILDVLYCDGFVVSLLLDVYLYWFEVLLVDLCEEMCVCWGDLC